MILIAYQILVFAVMVNESHGCEGHYLTDAVDTIYWIYGRSLPEQEVNYCLTVFISFYSNRLSMMLMAIQVLVFTAMVNDSLGCFSFEFPEVAFPQGRSLPELKVKYFFLSFTFQYFLPCLL